jgi:general secretion pathway protein M
MISNHPLNSVLKRYPAVALPSYVLVIFAIVAAAVVAIADNLDQRATVAAAADMLEQLGGRRPIAAQRSGASAVSVPAGSMFLEGQTVTVAGATLLERVASAITRVGGTVLSSQVDLQGAQSKAGFVSLIASSELSQPALQQMLYDLEAGMPFLFVDQMVVQPAVASRGTDVARLRVLLTVSGQWQSGK